MASTPDYGFDLGAAFGSPSSVEPKKPPVPTMADYGLPEDVFQPPPLPQQGTMIRVDPPRPAPVQFNADPHNLIDLSPDHLAQKKPGTYLQQLPIGSGPVHRVQDIDLDHLTPTAQKSTARFLAMLNRSPLVKQGYTFGVTSGYRSSSTSHHGAGNAIDLQIYKDGKPVGSPQWIPRGWSASEMSEMSSKEKDQLAHLAYKAGFKGAINEIDDPTEHATGPHFHFAYGMEERARQSKGYGNLAKWAKMSGFEDTPARPEPTASQFLEKKRNDILEPGRGPKRVRPEFIKEIAGAHQYSPRDQELLLAMIEQESGRVAFTNKKGGLITSSAGAEGLGQFMPGTLEYAASKHGVSVEEYKTSAAAQARLTARYTKELLTDPKYKTDGSWARMLVAYNAGPGTLDWFLKNKDAQLPEETKNHIAGILTNATGKSVAPEMVEDMVRDPHKFSDQINPKFREIPRDQLLSSINKPEEFDGHAAQFVSNALTFLTGKPTTQNAAIQGAVDMAGTMAAMTAKAANAFTAGYAPLIEAFLMGKKGDPNYKAWTAPWKDVEDQIDANGTVSLANGIWEIGAAAAMFMPGSVAGRLTAGVGKLGGALGSTGIAKSLLPQLQAAKGFSFLEKLGSVPGGAAAIQYGIGGGVAMALEEFNGKVQRGEYKDASWTDMMGEMLYNASKASVGGVALGLLGNVALGAAGGIAHKLMDVGPVKSALSGIVGTIMAPAERIGGTGMFKNMGQPAQIAGQTVVRMGAGASIGGFTGGLAGALSGQSYEDVLQSAKAGTVGGLALGAGSTVLAETGMKAMLDKYMMSNPYPLIDSQYGVGERSAGLLKEFTEQAHPEYKKKAISMWKSMLESLPEAPRGLYEVLTYDAAANALRMAKTAAKEVQWGRAVEHANELVANKQLARDGLSQRFTELNGIKANYEKVAQESELVLKGADLQDIAAYDAGLAQSREQVAQARTAVQQNKDPKKQAVLENAYKTEQANFEKVQNARVAEAKRLEARVDPVTQSNRLEAYQSAKQKFEESSAGLKDFDEKFAKPLAAYPEQMKATEEVLQEAIKMRDGLMDPAVRAARMKIEPSVYKPGSIPFAKEKEAEAAWLNANVKLGTTPMPKIGNTLQDEVLEVTQGAVNKAYQMFFSRATSPRGIMFEDLEPILIAQFRSTVDPKQNIPLLVEQTMGRLDHLREMVKTRKVLFTVGEHPPVGETMRARYVSVSAAELRRRPKAYVNPSTMRKFLEANGHTVQDQAAYDAAYNKAMKQIDENVKPTAAGFSMDVGIPAPRINFDKKLGNFRLRRRNLTADYTDKQLGYIQAAIDQGDTAMPVVLTSKDRRLLDRFRKELSNVGAEESKTAAKGIEESLGLLEALSPFLGTRDFQPSKYGVGPLQKVLDTPHITDEAVMGKEVAETVKQVKVKPGEAPPPNAIEIKGPRGQSMYYVPQTTTPESQALFNQIMGSVSGDAKQARALDKVLNAYRNTAEDRMGQEFSVMRDMMNTVLTPEQRNSIVAKQVNDLMKLTAFADNPSQLTARMLDLGRAVEAYSAAEASLTPEQKQAALHFQEGLKGWADHQDPGLGRSLQYFDEIEKPYQEQMDALTDRINATEKMFSGSVHGFTKAEAPNFLLWGPAATAKIARGITSNYKAIRANLTRDMSPAEATALDKAAWFALAWPSKGTLAKQIEAQPKLKELLSPLYHMMGELERLERKLPAEHKMLSQRRFFYDAIPRLRDLVDSKASSADDIVDILMNDLDTPGKYAEQATNFLRGLVPHNPDLPNTALEGIVGAPARVRQIITTLQKADPNFSPDKFVASSWQEAAKAIPTTAKELAAAEALAAGPWKERALKEVERKVNNNKAIFLMDGMNVEPSELIANRFRSVYNTIHENQFIKFFNAIKVVPDKGMVPGPLHPNGIVHLADKPNPTPPRVRLANGVDKEYERMSEIPGFTKFTYVDDAGRKFSSDQMMVHPDAADFLKKSLTNNTQHLLKPVEKISKPWSQMNLLGSPFPHYISLMSNVLLEHSLNPMRAIGVIRAGGNIAQSDMGYLLQANATRHGLNSQLMDNVVNILSSRIVSSMPEDVRTGYVGAMTKSVPGEQSGKLDNPVLRPFPASFWGLVERAMGTDEVLAKEARHVLSQNYNGMIPFGRMLAGATNAVGTGWRTVLNMDAIANRYMLHEPIQQAGLASYYLRASDIFQRHRAGALKGMTDAEAWRVSQQTAAPIVNRMMATLPYYWHTANTRNVLNSLLTTPDWFRNQFNAAKETFQAVANLAGKGGGKSNFSNLPEELQSYVINDAAKKFVMGSVGIVGFNQMVSYMTSGEMDIYHPIDSMRNGMKHINHLRENPSLFTRSLIDNDIYSSPVFGMYRHFTRALTEAFGGAGSDTGETNLFALGKRLVAQQASPAIQTGLQLAGMMPDDPFSTPIPKADVGKQVPAILRKIIDSGLNTEESFGTESRGSSLTELFGLAWDPNAPRLNPKERLEKMFGVSHRPANEPGEFDKRVQGRRAFSHDLLETRVRKRLLQLRKNVDNPEMLAEGLAQIGAEAVYSGYDDILPGKVEAAMGVKKVLMEAKEFENIKNQIFMPYSTNEKIAQDREKDSPTQGAVVRHINEEQRLRQLQFQMNMQRTKDYLAGKSDTDQVSETELLRKYLEMMRQR
jgi:hypothetical protein